MAYFVLLLVPHLDLPEGHGLRRREAGLLMGLYLGWIYLDLIQALVPRDHRPWSSALLGVVVGLVAFALLRGRQAEFPFGPALALGCVLVMLFSEQPRQLIPAVRPPGREGPARTVGGCSGS